MKRSLFLAAFAPLLLSASGAYGFGWYDWYGGGTTATATSWNGFGYAPVYRSWGWGDGNYAYAYTNTYPYARSQTSYNWPYASAFAYSSYGGRTAYASASAYDSPWWWGGGYTNVVAKTTGSPSYATAYSHASAWYTYQYWVPRAFWYGWTSYYGWYVPYYYRFYYWGWFDGDASDMSVYVNMAFGDGDDPTAWSQLLCDGWHDNGDGTFSQIGSTFSASDLVPGVQDGHNGWFIRGREGDGGTPYDILFLSKAYEVGGDNDYILIENRFWIRGEVGQPVPAPAAALPFLIGTWIGYCRRRRK